MSIVQISRQTSLTGRPLQEAINDMIQQMQGMSPYSMLDVRSEWPSSSRLTLRAGNHMTGSVDLTFGPPSTVTAQINLLSATAQGQRSRVEQDMLALANRHLPLPSGASSSTPTHAPPASPAGTPEAQQYQQQPQQPRRQFNWDTFGTILTGLFGGVATGMEAYNQVGNAAGQDAIAIAQEEAASAGKQASPIGPNTGLQHGDGFTLGPGKSVGPDAPLPGGRSPSDVRDDEGVEPPESTSTGLPTWAWWAIGIGGVAGLGALLWFVSRDDENREPEWRRNMSPREVRTYRRLQRIGKRNRKAKEQIYPISQLKREAVSMREAGYSVSEIASALGVNRYMVKEFLKSTMSKNYGFRYFL